MKKIILLFGAMLNSMLFAQWTDNSDVNTLVAESETSYISSVGTNDGKTYVVFLEETPEAYSLKVQLIDAEGNQQFGSEGMLINNNASNDYLAAVDTAGNLYVCFITTELQGRVNKISPSGEQLWGEEGINLGLGVAQIRILPTADGGAIIGWIYNITNGVMMKYNSEGIAEWDDVKTISSPNSNVGEMALLSDGSFIVLFHVRDAFFLPDSIIWAQRYDSEGNEMWDAPVQLSDHKTTYNIRYSLAQDGDVVYLGYYGVLGRYDAYLQRINPDGSLPWGMNGSDFSTNNDFYEMTTSLAYEEGSNYVWAISRFTNSIQSEYGEYIQKFHKESGARYLGDHAEKVFEVSADRYVHYGDLQLVFGKPLFLFSALASDIVQPLQLSVTYLDEMASEVWEEDYIPIATSMNDKSFIGFTKNVNGQSVAVWMETRNPTEGNKVYAQNFKIGGNGCLDAPNGQYPPEILVPDCATGWPRWVFERPGAGEYSLVQVVSGRSYTFSSSTASDLITIADEAGATVLTTGIGSLVWTADFDGIIRFYVHVDAECNWDDGISRNRSVECFDPVEQEYGCDQNYTRVGSVGFGINNIYGWYTANDFFVPMESEQYIINSIKINLSLVSFEFPSTAFDISILNDNEAAPGTVIETFTAQTPTLIENGESPFRFYLTFDLGGYELPVNPEEDTRYWISLTTAHGDMMAWLSSPYVEGWETAQTYQSNGGTNWQPVVYEDEFYEGTWSIDASCEAMGVSDMNSFDFTYYPNPVKDVLNISSQKAVSSISVYNLAGQQVINKADLSNGQIDVTALLPGVYVFRVTLEGNQIETFKIIKK